jgi:phosphopentomutase
MGKRILLIVLDSLGVGQSPDAASYGDEGADTFRHIVEKVPEIHIPNLIQLGISSIDGIDYLKKPMISTGAFGRAKELSNGKDTITGHWEIGGLYTSIPFKTFPDGFPAAFMKDYEEKIGIGTLGNYAASGTEILKKLGEEHAKTGKPIVYTSADSVFQIAANTAVIPLETLYTYCEIARAMLVGELQVGRVIARPFIYENGQYARTSDRKDYAVSPSGKTVLDHVLASGKKVYAVGKIGDIFNYQGISESIHTESNMDGVDKTIAVMHQDFEGFVFTNLVDFDSKYGHRRDPKGYATAIEDFDARLPEILSSLREDDILMLCADHGNDPVFAGWDHTREYVPILVYGSNIQKGFNIGTRESFADIGATISAYLDVHKTAIGTSFLKDILR